MCLRYIKAKLHSAYTQYRYFLITGQINKNKKYLYINIAYYTKLKKSKIFANKSLTLVYL
jgi:hypothetical protein